MRSAAVQGDKLNFDLGYEEKNANLRIHKKIQVFQFINPGPPSPPPHLSIFVGRFFISFFGFAKIRGVDFSVFVFGSLFSCLGI